MAGDSAIDSLEELRVADREALVAQGEVEQNWKRLARWFSDYPRKHNRGEIRRWDLPKSRDALEMAVARVEGLAERRGRPLPPYEPPVVTPIVRRAWTVGLAHARRVHALLHEAHARRRWIRRVFESWRGDADVEPLGDIEDFAGQDEARRKELAGVIREYWMALISRVLVVAAIAGFAIYLAAIR